MVMTRKVIVLLAVAAACMIWSPAARAQDNRCPSSVPFGDFQLGNIISCLDNAPVSALATAIGSVATVGNAQIICSSTDQTNIQGGSCQTASGSAGDKMVTISGNWGNPGSLGCPNPSGAPGVGRNVYSVRCNDGSGLLITVGYDVGLGR